MNLGFFDFQWVSDFSSENYIGGLDEIFKDVNLWFEDNKLIGGFWSWGSKINMFVHPNKKSLFNEMVDVAERATIQTSWQKEYPAPNRLYESVGFELVGNLYFWEKSLTTVKK